MIKIERGLVLNEALFPRHFILFTEKHESLKNKLMKIKNYVTAVALSSSVITALSGFSAEIDWQIPVNLFQGDETSEAFVSLLGDPLVAYNATSLTSGAIGEDTTVNGVLFIAAEAGTTVTGTTGEGIILNTGGNNEGAFGDGQFNGNTNIQNLIEGGSFNILNVTLSGLNIGTTYLIQILSHDGRGSRANALTAFSDGVTAEEVASLPLNLNNSNTGDENAGATGDFIIGTFTADAETQNFDVFGEDNSTNGINFRSGISQAAINAIQLRDITVLAADTDGDGISDLYEMSNGLDINVNDANIDSDGDGILNIDEFNNTPQLPAGNPDTDNDGLLDGEEVDGLVNTFGTPVASDDQLTTGVSLGAATNPFEPDSDDDGLLDGEEATGSLNISFNNEATDPNDLDTDDDELLDEFEITHNLNANDATGENGDTGDPDGDTLDNFNEQTEGTDPQDNDTDDDGLPDAGPIVNGNPTGELDTEDNGTFIVVVGENSDPLNPDTDNDKLSDAEEVLAGLDGFITDANLFDTDGDGVPDAYESLEGSDPSAATGAAVTPNYATIAWSVAAVDETTNTGTTIPGVGAEGIRADGTLLYAENYSGEDATVNGVLFTGNTNVNIPRCSDNLFTLFSNSSNQGAFYQGPDTELQALLDSVWFTPNAAPIPHLLLTGLTVGEDYFVQFGVSDNRDGSRIDRHVTIDGFGGNVAADPIGATNTIYGGSNNSALIFTGTFIATLETQMFDVEVFAPNGNTAEIFASFLQVRIDDGTLPTPSEIVIVDCGFDANRDYFIELATDATGATVSESDDLAIAFAAIDATNVTVTGNIITIAGAAIDANADGTSFFQVSF